MEEAREEATDDIEIGRLAGDDEAHACAAMMASTSPWLTLGRTFDDCLGSLTDPAREVWVARSGGAARGVLILIMRGAFVGYIQTVCVDAAARGSGLGTRLVRFAEERIFREYPNVFLCVSSFNTRAKALYERLGYAVVGELPDYPVRGYSEVLMRKSIAPMRDFFSASSPADPGRSDGGRE
jgi:ribosomal protein S18 acetylase RimI-like enzyme